LPAWHPGSEEHGTRRLVALEQGKGDRFLFFGFHFYGQQFSYGSVDRNGFRSIAIDQDEVKVRF
jgi:hypothetical protein